MGVETLTVTRSVVNTSRRSLLGWTIALVAITTMYVSLYPSIGGLEMQEMIDSLPEALVEALGYESIMTAAGYINSTVYALLGPILLGVFAIGTGARLVGGSEEEGILELEFTAPIARAQVYVQRWLSLAINVTLLVTVVALTTFALVVGLNLDVALGNLLAGTVGLWLLILGWGTIAFAVGAITGRRSIGIGVAAAVAVLSFVLDALGPMVDLGWMQSVSTFSWYVADQPLSNGWDWSGIGLLALVPVAFGLLGMRVFERRDLMV